MLECVHHCEELFVVDFVVYLRQGEFPGVESYWVQPVLLITL